MEYVDVLLARRSARSGCWLGAFALVVSLAGCEPVTASSTNIGNILGGDGDAGDSSGGLDPDAGGGLVSSNSGGGLVGSNGSNAQDPDGSLSNPPDAGGTNGGSTAGNNGGNDDAGTSSGCEPGAQTFFASADISSRLSLCRSCHFEGGLADKTGGDKFLISFDDPSSDLTKLRDSWLALGRNNPTSRILKMASGEQKPHTGGTLWTPSSQAYADVAQLFSLFDDPNDCAYVAP